MPAGSARAGAIATPRLLGLALAVGLGFAAMFCWMTDTLWRFSWGDRLPQVLQVIQFPYRLSSYVLLCAAGLMLVACRYAAHARGARRRLGGALLGLLAAATAVQVGFGLHQVWTARTYGPAARVLADLDHLPKDWYDRNYFNTSVRKLEPVELERPWIKTHVPNYDVAWVELAFPRRVAGHEVKTNVVPSPLIEIAPAEAFIGQVQEYAVVRVPESRTRVLIQAGAARTPATVLGALATFASLGAAADLLACLARPEAARRAASMLRRRARPPRRP